MPFRTRAPFTEVMQHTPRLQTAPAPFGSRLADASAGPIIARGRLLDSVADRDLQGTLEDIARVIGVQAEDLVTRAIA